MHTKILYGFYFFLISLATLLLLEYSYVKRQQIKLHALQHEYQKYVTYYKKRVQTQLQAPNNFFFEPIKNVQEQFLVVNREVPYLKQGALELCNDTLKPGIIELYEFNDNNIVSVKADQSSKKIELKWPIDRDKFWVSSKFGIRKKRDGTTGFHYGLDMAALKQTLVKAAMDGVIVEAGYSTSGYGNCVVINHKEKIMTRYAHLDSIVVKVGDRVKVYDTIGRVGNTGYVLGTNGDASNATHLHFEVIIGKKRIDPLLLLT